MILSSMENAVRFGASYLTFMVGEFRVHRGDTVLMVQAQNLLRRENAPGP